MTDETFTIRAYGKSELAMMYFPDLSKETAMKKLRFWLSVNPRLRHLISKNFRNFTPKQVRLIIGQLRDNPKTKVRNFAASSDLLRAGQSGVLLPNRWPRFKQCRPDIGGQSGRHWRTQ